CAGKSWPDLAGVAGGDHQLRSRCAPLRRLPGRSRRYDRAAGLEHHAGGAHQARAHGEPRRVPDPGPAHLRRDRAAGGTVSSDGVRQMRVWLILVLTLAAALIVAVCAGHDWVTPLDVARAAAGDESLRSRLLVEWRMPRVLAAAL